MTVAIMRDVGLMADVGQFGARLRALRERAGLTQEQLAERAGVKRGAVARWESGEREPGWSNVVALCKALGVSCEAFMQHADDAPAEKAKGGRPKKRPASDHPGS